ncbi:MAG: N(G),N(G)-dimethylarginine dimethylaminohydrolase [Microbacteriaceae bacterium]|nr:N(G),N(G)-dimethylarginine dimethylaminohydrolase [Microbacteriaceae bacterium]
MTVIARPVPFLRRLAAAAVSAIVVAAIAQVATMLLFFGGQASQLGQIGDFLLASGLVLFVVSAVFALIGIYRFWYLRLVAGLVAGVVAAIVGSTVTVVTGGTAISAGVIGQLFATLLGLNLPFVLAATIATLTAGYAVWRLVVVVTGTDARSLRVAIVRPPADNLADGQLTHLERSAIDTDLADTQWDSYVAAFVDNGWDVVEVPVASGQADSVFIEDAVVLFGELAVIASPGAESRRGEIAEVEKTVRGLGLKVARIEQPGTLDGGDVLKVGKTVYVGRGGRTNAEGIRQLRALVSPLGYTVVAVPVTKALHLKSTVTALPDGTIIGYPPVVDDSAIFERFLAVPEAGGLAVVVLAADTVLMASSAPQSAALIADLGYRVVTVDISEFEKLEGCVTCLSVRLR